MQSDVAMRDVKHDANGGFILHPQLQEDSIFIASLPLSDVRLMQECRWLWLLLVPRIASAEEILDLSAAQRAQLTEETALAARLLRQAGEPCDKINIAALGNKVRQLHIHVIARQKNDAAWPNPVWGQGARQDMHQALQRRRITALKSNLADFSQETA